MPIRSLLEQSADAPQEIQQYVDKVTNGATSSDPFEVMPFGSDLRCLCHPTHVWFWTLSKKGAPRYGLKLA